MGCRGIDASVLMVGVREKIEIGGLSQLGSVAVVSDAHDRKARLYFNELQPKPC